MDNAAVLNEVLFDRFGFKGNSDDYYDPRNSFFNDVLDRRLGIPITLSAVYIEVAQRLKFPIWGVGMPGHFIVKYMDQTEEFFLDPFYGGAGKPSFFRANATGDVTVPLLRARGTGTTANERAAQLSLSAETDRLRFTVSEESFRTATAYLNLIGAQQTVTSLEESDRPGTANGPRLTHTPSFAAAHWVFVEQGSCALQLDPRKR